MTRWRSVHFLMIACVVFVSAEHLADQWPDFFTTTELILCGEY
jgi:hypothetical protein